MQRITMPHWPKPSTKPLEGNSLDRMKLLLKRVGNPHKKMPPCVHVAGTNGKGSTIAFIKTILEQAGYKVNCYTSPHMLYFNERIYVEGYNLDDDTIHQYLETCRQACGDDLTVSFFEGTTVAAFLAFADSKADICLIECGVGGRFDATNINGTCIL